MHLLAAQPGAIEDGSEAVDLGQRPGDIVFLTAADTEVALIASAQRIRLEVDPEAPSVRAANLMQLAHNLSVDLYVEAVASHARLIVVRLLGGRSYWPYGVARLSEAAAERRIPIVWLPGDDQPDAELAALSTVPQEAAHRIWQYLVHGGGTNARNFLAYAASLLGRQTNWLPPVPLMRAGILGADDGAAVSSALHWRAGRPVVAIVFYRALVQAADTAAVEALAKALRAERLNPLPIYVASLKDPAAAEVVRTLLAAHPPSVVVNATGFAVGTPGVSRSATPFDAADCPVLQAVFSSSNESGWLGGTRGLGPREIAMNVALPEVDGRIFTRAVSFKDRARRDAAVEADIVAHRPVADRIAFVAALARNWARLRHKRAGDRRLALVLANYPNRDGRIGNGVGLDTPASAATIIGALGEAGYAVGDAPSDGAGLLDRLTKGPTNAGWRGRDVQEWLPGGAYRAAFETLPAAVRAAVHNRWGPPESDPFWMPERGGIALPLLRFGNLAVGVQPARGYNIDPVESYHDPALVPPHNYFAFYAWIRRAFDAHAVVHLGKHGNLEWLPGKALALSQECFPEAALGPLPHLYPFIVNDPGEGTQAKRRSAAVIVDHLTPPLTRAESYGPLRDLELLVDEYYEAAGVDPRRLKVLGPEIVSLARSLGLDRDCGLSEGASEIDTLAALDNHLCEIKEMQIRDGLHVFGRSPEDPQCADLLVALARPPRPATGGGSGESILRALARDLSLGSFDPLICRLGDPWTGPRPQALVELGDAGPWRTCGDTVERLELLARRLVDGSRPAPPEWAATQDVLRFVAGTLRPAVEACGSAEIAGLLAGFDGRFVPPGPSGAPTRGRPDVLPTGRNFYSVDTRTVPTPAAWTLGWASAQRLVERYAQDHGGWPRRLALSAWGTANMRTGGDDIAQAMALIGAKPVWDTGSRRVSGFEILPLSLLDRPRVDVTLRISGFFRDAFPGLIDLFDSAVRAVASLEEDPGDNPLAATVRSEVAAMRRQGEDDTVATQRAGTRVFGSRPGAYGAGLQALIDERGWEAESDLARAYLAWGGYAYGGGQTGEAAHATFERRLSAIQAVVQNQDNREHDLLDSDDYYQFEGGLAATAYALSGERPTVYHNDHSLPENPRIRTLEEEIARVVRARVVNPKWIAGVMRHGYKGAFEMAATVDYVFAFQATARCVADHHFDAIYDAYVVDEAVRTFFEFHNPAALTEMCGRLLEAQDRGLWRPRSNASHSVLTRLSAAPGGSGSGGGEPES